ncbi:MAG: CTP synthase, partial [Muribaculaceae bacterium]|nr:CTP synthase [Muribaculaceae bacterium]
AYDGERAEDSIAARAYGKTLVSERHRHRFEFNDSYRKVLEDAGLRCVGRNPVSGLVEVVEVPSQTWMVGTQYHPEYQSTVLHPNPLFLSFVKAAIAKAELKN